MAGLGPRAPATAVHAGDRCGEQGRDSAPADYGVRTPAMRGAAPLGAATACDAVVRSGRSSTSETSACANVERSARASVGRARGGDAAADICKLREARHGLAHVRSVCKQQLPVFDI